MEGEQEGSTAKRRRRSDRKVIDGQTRLISEQLVPNDDITFPYGPVTVTRMVFDILEMDRVFSKLKRRQGATVSEVTVALVAHAMQMRGLSINRMEDLIDDDEIRMIYDISDEVDKNDLYRTGRILGDNIEPVIRHIDRMLKDKLGLTFTKVFMDWSATYLDGKPTKMVRFGHTKDHRPDRPQVCFGMVTDATTGVPCGLTVVPGNIIDTTHFGMTYRLVKPFLDPKCLIVFDNGGYSETNGKLVTGDGFDFLTRAQMNKSNDRQIASASTEWEYLDEDICAHTYRGNLGYTKCIYFSVSKYNEKIEGYYRKAKRDWDEMQEMKAALDGKKRPRKKYRNGNVFVDTRIYRQFPLDGLSEAEAIEEAVKRLISGREGYFILMSSRRMTASEMLSTYRSRNAIETGYRDIKHDIDIRPLRCTDDSSIRGRVLIAFLAYFVMQFSKMLVPEMRDRTAESIVSELNSFSLTLHRVNGRTISRTFSNFGPMIRAFLDKIPPISGVLPRGSRLGRDFRRPIPSK